MKRGYNGEPKPGSKKHKGENVSHEAPSLQEQQQSEEEFLMFQSTKVQPSAMKHLRGKACPWMSKKTADIRDSLLRFHNEIIQFTQYISASPEQREARLLAFTELKKLIEQVIPEGEVRQFGSSALGLQLPDGDIDVTILVEDAEEIDVLSDIYDRLKRDTSYGRLEFRKGKVPIINVHSLAHDFQIDISVNKRDGLKQLEEIRRSLNGMPQFRYLFMTMKCILKIRGYSETYHGYIGSYLLFCMVFEYLFKKYDSLTKFNKRFLLSQDLIGFLDFYSSTDWSKLEVYVGRGIVRERQSGFGAKPVYFRFLSPENQDDIGSRAFKIREIFHCFRNRVQLIRNKNFRRGQSVLKELLNPSLEQFAYPGRGKI